MKKKILYIVLVIIFITAIIVTAIKGLNVGLIYCEGTTITFTENSEIDISNIKAIAKEIWNDEDVLIQRVEFFNDSASIKIKEANDEQITQLCDKLNEKYSSELKTSDFKVDYVPNVKIRSIVEPFIFPIGLSTILIIAYYAIRFKGAKQMANLLEKLVVFEGLLYSIYALVRLPVNGLTMPLFMIVYIATICGYTFIAENKRENTK